MNANLKRHAKRLRSMHLMHLNPGVPFQTTDYGKMCSQASQYRVTTFGPYVTDTRKFRVDVNNRLSWDDIKLRQMDVNMDGDDFSSWLNAIRN